MHGKYIPTDSSNKRKATWRTTESRKWIQHDTIKELRDKTRQTWTSTYWTLRAEFGPNSFARSNSKLTVIRSNQHCRHAVHTCSICSGEERRECHGQNREQQLGRAPWCCKSPPLQALDVIHSYSLQVVFRSRQPKKKQQTQCHWDTRSLTWLLARLARLCKFEELGFGEETLKP